MPRACALQQEQPPWWERKIALVDTTRESPCKATKTQCSHAGEQLKPLCHNYWARALEPGSHNYCNPPTLEPLLCHRCENHHERSHCGGTAFAPSHGVSGSAYKPFKSRFSVYSNPLSTTGFQTKMFWGLISHMLVWRVDVESEPFASQGEGLDLWVSSWLWDVVSSMGIMAKLHLGVPTQVSMAFFLIWCKGAVQLVFWYFQRELFHM